MIEGVAKVGRVVWPLALGAFLGWAAIFYSDKAFESSSIVNLVLAAARLLLDPVYLEDLKIPLARTVVGFAGLASFVYLALRDYSEFFPKSFAIDVYFDLPGMTKALGQFTETEFKKLNIASQWKNKYVAYFSSLNDSLQGENINFRFDCSDINATVGEGKGIFKVQKARHFGSISVQSYKVVEASGTLKFYAANDLVSKKSPLVTQYALVGECLVQATVRTH